MHSNPVTKILASVVVIMCATIMAYGQASHNVGIGTTTPHESAMLEITSVPEPTQGINPKGLIIPKFNQIQRDLMETYYPNGIPSGLLIFETDSDNFWFYKHFNPPVLVPPYGEWVQLASSGGVGSGMPQGGIIMWSGTIASIPAGWSLCDGTNGTPDLTDKFVVSVANAGENPALSTQGVSVVNTIVAPDKRFYKVAFIQKL